MILRCSSVGGGELALEVDRRSDRGGGSGVRRGGSLGATGAVLGGQVRGVGIHRG